jgi:hypothetical protein
VTGVIVGLAGSTRTGTIQCEDGALLVFSAAGVLGDFDSLAVGHRVSFQLDGARPRHTAVGVFHEPFGGVDTGRKPGDPPDLRYAGFDQAENVRSYRFNEVARGQLVHRFVVTVDLTLMLKHRISVQEAPVLCLRKLAADLKSAADSQRHELDDRDLLAYASSRAAAIDKRRPRHAFAGRRGAQPPKAGLS